MQAIVLARRNFRENDQVISLFTREKGKITALARGVKKIVSKNSAFLEPFFFVEAEVLPGREVRHLTKATGVKSYRNIRADFRKSVIAGKAAVFIDRLVQDDQNEPAIFSLLERWLNFIDENNTGTGHYFGLIVRLFKILGYEPVLNKCVFCKKPAPPAATRLFFSPAGGGLACLACRKKAGSDIILPLDVKDIAEWNIFFEREIFEWSFVITPRLERAIMDFAEYHTEKKLAKISQI